MCCGCGARNIRADFQKSIRIHGASKAHPRDIRASTDVPRTNALMCRLCRHGGPSATACGASGELIAHVTLRLDGCPQGRHTDDRGRVLWLGLLWRGVPWPLRWRLPRGTRIPDCGCLDALRRFAGFLREWRFPMPTDTDEERFCVVASGPATQIVAMPEACTACGGRGYRRHGLLRRKTSCGTCEGQGSIYRLSRHYHLYHHDAEAGLQSRFSGKIAPASIVHEALRSGTMRVEAADA